MVVDIWRKGLVINPMHKPLYVGPKHSLGSFVVLWFLGGEACQQAVGSSASAMSTFLYQRVVLSSSPL